MWTLEMKWTMNQKEERRNQTYEIQVGRTTNMDIVDSVRETPHSSHYDLTFVLSTNILQSIHRSMLAEDHWTQFTRWFGPRSSR